MRTLLKRGCGALLAIGLVLPAAAQQAPSLAPTPPASAPAAANPQAVASPAAVATPGGAVAPELSQQNVETWLDGFMHYALARAEIAGAVVVVVKDGQVLVQKGYGTSDVATFAPVDPQTTLFRPGSVSKLFTWTAVMQLLEQGRVDLDRDVNTYLDFTIPPYQGKPVTLRNLMTHTAGFQETTKDLIFEAPHPEPAMDMYLKQNMPDRIFPPGKIPSYSNYGATLAGYIVQRVSGEKFDDYIERHIFAPLDMKYATFRQPLPAALQPLMSQGYDVAGEPAKPFEVVGPAPAGSSSMSGNDMAHFMIAQLQDGAYQGQRILKAETAQMMHSTALNNIPPLNSMLLGFYQMNRNGHRIIGHAGDTQWFHSELTLFLDDHVGFFISMNSLGVDAAAGPLRVALREQFADRYFPAPVPRTKQDAAATRADDARIAGTYLSSRREETTFFSLLYYMLEGTAVAPNASGEIAADGLKNLASQPQAFNSVAPLLWRAANGKMRLGATQYDDSLIWTDDESPYEVYTPVPWFKSPVWLKPALIASVMSLLLTGFFWPVTALFRRRYSGVLSLRGVELVSYRLTKVAALLDGLVMAAWPVVVAIMLKTFALNGSFDPVILSLHWLTIVIFPLALLIFVWNAWVVWTTRVGLRGAFARIWSLVLVASGVVLVWSGSLFHLIGIGLSY